MCIRCLERLYSIHAAKIGPFPDISILLRYMRTSNSVETRQRLLSLVAVSMGVNDEKYEPVNARENLEQLLNWGSIYQLCELSSECHINSDTVPLTLPETTESAGEVLTSTQISKLALACLKRIVLVHKSLNSNGIPFFPIPIAKKLICERPQLSEESEKSQTTSFLGLHSNALAIICQGLLCRKPEIVHSTAELLQSLMSHNDKACSKLYLTGVFFFVFTYKGSDWRPLAKLLDATHMKQDFFIRIATGTKRNEFAAETRSILGNLLPDGLLKVLMNHGADRFAEIFVQDQHDTPEGELPNVLIDLVNES